MKNLQLSVSDHLYETLLAMLRGLPEKDVIVVEDDANQSDEYSVNSGNINRFAGKIKSFAAIKDPVAWQREQRAEWDREWDR